MAIAYFPSLEQGDTIEIAFVGSQGSEILLRLLVDTAFIGQTCFALADTVTGLEHSAAGDAHAFGAISGVQPRVIVQGAISALAFRFEALAMLTDVSRLGLPPGVHGMVGLRFLRMFRRWGAERTESGWRFFLETNSN